MVRLNPGPPISLLCRAMIDRSRLAVFCVQHKSGGAWQTMKYATKQDIPYINLHEQLEEAE